MSDRPGGDEPIFIVITNPGSEPVIVYRIEENLRPKGDEPTESIIIT